MSSLKDKLLELEKERLAKIEEERLVEEAKAAEEAKAEEAVVEVSNKPRKKKK